MNQFIFCVVVDNQILYGTLTAQNGADAKVILESKFEGRVIQGMEFKGVANKTFEFDACTLPERK